MADRFVSVAGSGSNTGLDASNEWTLAQATANAAAGNIHHCKAGTYIADDSSSSSIMDIDVAGTIAAWVEWRGYTTTINDFTIGDTPPAILDASTNTLTNCAQTSTIGSAHAYNRFRGFQFTGASGDGFTGSNNTDSLTFEGCKFDTNGDRGFQGDDNAVFVGCEFTGNTTSAIDADNNTVLLGCKIHNEASTVVLTQTVFVFNSLFYNNGNGINVRSTSTMYALGNTFDGDNQASSIGLQTVGGAVIPYLVYNNIFFDLGTGVDFSTGGTNEVRSRGHNLFSSCTNNYDTIADALSDIDDGTTDPFTDSAGRDYTLASGSTAIDAGLDGGNI